MLSIFTFSLVSHIGNHCSECCLIHIVFIVSRRNFLSRKTYVQWFKFCLEKIIKFRIKYICRSGKCFYLCTPRKRSRSEIILLLSVKRIKLKIISINACENKKNGYFCTRFENESTDKNIRHVPRHIELTAVLKATSKQNKESKIIERLN